MALRLSRNLKQEPTEEVKKGFDVSGENGKSYNLDEIETGKTRDTDASLKIQVKKDVATEDLKVSKNNSITAEASGAMAVGDILVRKGTDSEDYKKYLFGCDESKTGYVPPLTLRRPKIIWTDYSKDNINDDSNEDSSIYKQMEELIEAYVTINEKFKVLLEDGNSDILKRIEEASDILYRLDTSIQQKKVITEITPESITDSNIPTIKLTESLYKHKNAIINDSNISVSDWNNTLVGQTFYADAEKTKIVLNEDNNYSLDITGLSGALILVDENNYSFSLND